MMNLNIVATYCEDDRYIWCIAQDDAYLYKFDKKDEIIEQIIPLDDNVYLESAFLKIERYNNWLVFIPCNAEDIVLVDITSLVKFKIELPQAKEYVGTSTHKFRTGIIWNDSLFMFGFAYPGIIKVDLTNNQVRVIDEWLAIQKMYVNDYQDGCFFEHYCMLENYVYIPFANSNAVMRFDLQKEEVLINRVGDEHQRYVSIEQDGNFLWLVPRDGSKGSIIKWNPNKNEVFCIDNYPIEYDYHERAFYRTQVIGDKLLLFAHRGECNICIDTQTGQMITFPHLYNVEGIKGCKYPVVGREKEQIWIMNGSEYIIWDYKRNYVISFKYKPGIEICRRNEYERVKKLVDTDNFILESEEVGIEGFLSYIQCK